MDITCPQCKTEYEFEDEKVSPAGITVKCTNCNYMFKVRRKAVVETEFLPQQGQPQQGQPQQSAQDPTDAKRWMIRTTQGQVFHFKELTTLQQWIVERKVVRDDQISRSGETWKRLGDIAELASFFQVVDAAMAAEEAQAASGGPSGPQPIPSAPIPPSQRFSGAPSRPPTGVQEPAFTSDAAQFQSSVGRSAAWEDGGGRLPTSQHATDSLDDEIPRHRMGRLLGIVILLALVGGVVIVGFALRERIMGLFSGADAAANEAYQSGREHFLKDDEQSLQRADENFAKAPKDSALAQAARAEVFTTWAQHLKDHAVVLEQRARRLENTPQGSESSAADAKRHRLKAAQLRNEASKKLIQAETYASVALKMAKNKGEVIRAMADYMRLLGNNQDAARKYLSQARKLLPDDPETIYVEAALAADENQTVKAEQMLSQAMAKSKARLGKSLLRAAFRLAVLLFKQDHLDKAQIQAEAILQANADHGWASELLEEIKARSSIPAVAQPAPSDAGPLSKEGDQGTPRTGARPGGGQASAGTLPLTGGSYQALVRQGNALSERGRTMQAFKVFERALKQKPDGAEALTGIGFCHLDQERFSSAISFFRKALSSSPSFGEALIGMAEAYKVQGNLQRALDYYKAYLRTSPGGEKSIMARRNVTDLENKLGTTPTPAPAPAPSLNPAQGPAPTPGPPPLPGPAPAPSPELPPTLPE